MNRSKKKSKYNPVFRWCRAVQSGLECTTPVRPLLSYIVAEYIAVFEFPDEGSARRFHNFATGQAPESECAFDIYRAGWATDGRWAVTVAQSQEFINSQR